MGYIEGAFHGWAAIATFSDGLNRRGSSKDYYGSSILRKGEVWIHNQIKVRVAANQQLEIIQRFSKSHNFH